MPPDRDADDLAQDLLQRVLLKIGTFKGKASIGTWLNKLAINVRFDQLRKRQPEEETEAFDGDPAQTGPAENPLKGILLKEAFARLSTRQKQIVRLRSMGLKLKAISEKLRISKSQAQRDLERSEKLLLEAIAR